MRSLLAALDAGADGLEFDVHRTADGVIVLHHDDALADGRLIAETPLDALRGNGVALDTLAELLQTVDGRAELFVELKGRNIEMAVEHQLRDYRGAFALHSFDHSAIARLSAAGTPARLGVLVEDGDTNVAELLQRTGAHDLWPHWSLINDRLVTEAHAAGARVIVWTVNEPALMRRLTDAGVDGLCTDDVRLVPRA